MPDGVDVILIPYEEVSFDGQIIYVNTYKRISCYRLKTVRAIIRVGFMSLLWYSVILILKVERLANKLGKML